MAKRPVLDKEASFADSTSETGGIGGSSTGVSDRTMIWSEQEVCAKQVTQFSTYACGATAVIYVLETFSFSQRFHSSLAQGVQSQAVVLIPTGTHHLPSINPERRSCHSNPEPVERCVMVKQLRDAWHHQMVFGVGQRGMYLPNPLEFVSEEALWPLGSSGEAERRFGSVEPAQSPAARTAPGPQLGHDERAGLLHFSQLVWRPWRHV
uniref:Uncharacterized protein n=1 Tax=Timema bartmani TaxID=61472 RepID=A0A7R9EVC9_9NEOP|nr:unnamed protein product [Timema bartmani]